MRPNTSFRFGTVILFAAAVAGLILALYNYFTPLTGVTGTAGALLAVVASAVIACLAIILAITPRRWGRVAWRIVLLLLLAGNCFAGILLHEWWLCLTMIIGFVALCINTFRPVRVTGVARS